MNKFVSKSMLLLCDTLFFIICEKIIILLSCNQNDNTWILDSNVICWENQHLSLATFNLILLGMLQYTYVCVICNV